jgi:exopolysaccharide biosynthesis polyprenyl glycosylphosphotransferase
MSETKRRFVLNAFKVFDLALLIVAFALASLLSDASRGTLSFVEFLSMKVTLGNVLTFVVLLPIWHLVFVLFGLYESKRLASRSSEMIDTAKATTLVSILLPLAASLFHIRMVTLSFVALYWCVSTVSIAFGRFAVRWLIGRMRRNGRNLHHILILGTNARATAFASRIEAQSELGYRLLGFVDQEWEGIAGFLGSGHQLCCDFDGLAGYLRTTIVDEVAIYLPLRSFYALTCRVAAICEQHGVIMRFDSDLFDLKKVYSRAEEFDGEPQITVYTAMLDGWQALVKRIQDFAMSLALLVILSPLFLLISMLIKLTSSGPVFFLQERVGRNKRRFHIFKFRTMVPDAEKMMAELEALNELSGPVFKIKNDPRLTPIGRFLRRSSLDELPQLLNVLLGDMSLVGPRPMAVRDFEGFSEDWQRRRFSVPPGITCLWQINGRSSIPFQQWMEMDMQYIAEWSLWLDLKILARTIPAVWKGTGAA